MNGQVFDLAAIEKLIQAASGFVVAYAFQIIGAIIFLLIGLKASAIVARAAQRLADRHHIDPTINRFMGNAIRLVLVGFLILITLGNFGISVAPLIAAVGAAAFGATVAIQGPLSNYGAGLSIILSRPFKIGDHIAVKGVHGVVEDITLANTVLRGEDGEQITVPNKQIVGEIMVNSDDRRIVETTIKVATREDIGQVIEHIRDILAQSEDVGQDPAPHIGIEEFVDGGYKLGIRYWIPAKGYFPTLYATNARLRDGLATRGLVL